MSDWDPALYTRFEQQRTRPAADLLAGVPLASAAAVVDLGCGPGNSTELLAQRYAGAQLVGVDSSETMLASARRRLPHVRFERADIATWASDAPCDLIYANASLQWVADHERLLPRLIGQLRPGGVLAIQVPDNRAEPMHTSMRELAAAAPFAPFIAQAASSRIRVESPERYYELLAPLAEVNLWRTAYYHPLPHAAAIVEWVSSTALRPYLEPLSEALRRQFLADYERRIDSAYRRYPDGSRLLRYPRLFIVARRRDSA